MDERVERVREECVRRQGAGLTRAPYPEDLKTLAVSYVTEKRAEGVSVKQLSEELGISLDTLWTWLGARSARAARFRPVQVVSAAAAEARSGLTLRTANGHQVEGLDVPTLVRLLRDLDGR